MKLNIFKKSQSQGANTSRPVLKSNMMEKISSDPFLDWVLVLVLGLVVALSLAGLDISVYLDTSASLKSSPTAGKAQGLPLDSVLLDKVLQEYSIRASKHESLTQGYTAPKDPSLP